jgi:hypothetical protein
MAGCCDYKVYAVPSNLLHGANTVELRTSFSKRNKTFVTANMSSNSALCETVFASGSDICGPGVKI